MKRVLFGVLWFVIFLIVLNIILGIVMGVTMTHGMGDVSHLGFQQRMDAAKAFAQVHAGTLATWRLIVLLASIVLAVAGTLTGKLPGTRKEKPAAPGQ